MKKYLLLLLSLPFINLSAQQTDTVSMGPGYIYQTYYSLQNGTIAQQAGNTWDLQIALNLFSASLRTNNARGTQLYRPTISDTSAWAALDTSGMSPLYDSDTSWEESAFNAGASGHPDYGWGYYTGGGNLWGKKIYLIKLLDGTMRKIWIKNLVGGDIYNIRLAKLDNTSDTLLSIKKTDFPGKNFVYLNLSSTAIVDIDPLAEDWDFMVTKYASEVAPAVFYPVTGILSNYETEVAEAQNVDVNTITNTGYPFVTNISAIGYDWKSYNSSTNQYDIKDSLVYWIKTQTDDVYKIIIQAFGGAVDGNTIFSKEWVGNTGLEENKNELAQQVLIYPNPASDHFNLVLDSRFSGETIIRVWNISGKMVLQKNMGSQTNNFQVYQIGTSGFQKGIHFVELSVGGKSTTLSLVVQ